MNTAARLVLSTLACLTLALVSCGEPAPTAPVANRLVDDFSPGLVSRPGAAKAAFRQSQGSTQPFIWRFGDPGSAEEWQAVTGVGGLTVREGRLTGESTTAVPILRLASIQGVDPGDMLYEVQVRMRVSAGEKFGLHFIAETPNDLDKVILSGMELPWPNEAPITSGEGMTTFTLRPPFPVYGSGLHEMLLRPTDAAGARFEIESVRVVFRREHLASIPSGVGWLGMSEIYRESVVSRSPETIRWPVTLPDRPRLSLSLATLDERPVTFRVAVQPDEGAPVQVLERTLTTPHRWEEAEADLDPWRGRKVTLSLALDAESPGTLGVWAAPTVVCRRPPQTAQARGDKADRPQAVILIMTDTLRPDRLDAYGNPRQTAPTLTRLAREGALFRDAQSQATWTKVAAPVLLTSLYPLTTGVRDFTDRVPSTAVTLAEAFRKGGYTTLGFTSAPFTGTFSNMQQGYEELYESPLTLASSKTARPITDLLLPWLDHHREEPFFAFVHYFDPHQPYRPDPPFDRLWGEPAWAGEHDADNQKAIAAIQDPERQSESMPMPVDFKAAGVDLATFRERELTWYDGSIREMDTELERLMERLRELGLDQRTLLVFTSDHGEEFFEHGLEGHGQTAYQELTHVPLVVRYPGVVPSSQVIDETVSLIDVMPTMLALSHLPVPEAVQGQSLTSLMKAKAGTGSWKPRPVFTDRPAAPHFASPAPRSNESFSVIYEGWKLVWNTRRPAGAPEYELYDHHRDSGDTRDVAAQHPDVVRKLARLIAGWKQDSQKRRLPADDVAARDLRPEERERLRALGYIR
jgi:arylsulfatase A-like enzyme